MNHTDFFDSLKAGDVKPLYLLEGAEEYIKAQALSRLCQLLLPAGLEQMNLCELVNPEADALIAAAETLPFMADRRVLIVRDSELLSTAKKEGDDTQQAVVEYLEHLSPSTCLVFVVKGKADARKSLYQWLKKHGAIVDFSPMGDAEAANWAMRTLRALGKQLDLAMAQALVFTVGHDAALLKQEMEKLAAYLDERETITQEDIDAVCVRSLECSVFQMVDAQAAGRNQDACQLLNSVLEGGTDRFMVLSMLLRQYRILTHMRRLMDERTPASALASLLGIPPFAVSRTQAQARRYTPEKLQAAYDYLYELEYRLKSGRTTQEGSVETALFRLDAILNAGAADAAKG